MNVLQGVAFTPPPSSLCVPPLLPTRSVLDPDGSPALGPDRPTSGVCGAPIRQAALEFVRAARDVIDSRQLGLTIIGVGGVTCGQHVCDMLAAGADFVQSATGMMWNPLLADAYHTLHQQQQEDLRLQQQQQEEQEKGQCADADSEQQQDQQEGVLEMHTDVTVKQAAAAAGGGVACAGVGGVVLGLAAA